MADTQKNTQQERFFGTLVEVRSGTKNDGGAWVRAGLDLGNEGKPLKIRAYDGVAEFLLNNALEGKRCMVRGYFRRESFEPEPGRTVNYRVLKANFIELAKPKGEAGDRGEASNATPANAAPAEADEDESAFC